MNLSSTVAVTAPRFSPQQLRVRWAIVAAGVVVNAAILLPALIQPKSTEAPASTTYLPPTAATSSPAPISTSPISTAQPQTRLAQADALARAGYRDAAVEQYLEAMAEYVKFHQ